MFVEIAELVDKYSLQEAVKLYTDRSFSRLYYPDVKPEDAVQLFLYWVCNETCKSENSTSE
jgi:hypothetical protein